MANPSWLVPAAVALLTPLALAALRKPSARMMPVDATGMRTLRLPKAFVVLGWIAMGITLLFVYGGIISMAKGERLSIFLLICAIGFGAMALSLIRNGHHHAVSFDEERLIVTDARRRTEECAWKDITSGRVHPLSKMIVLRTSDLRRLRINAYLIGSDDLFRTMAERTALPVPDLVAKARSAA